VFSKKLNVLFCLSTVMCGLVLTRSPAHAQVGGAESESSPGVSLDTVNVRGNRDLEARFAATGSRVTVGRRDIEAMGANTVGDVLRQTPGMQVTTTANGGLEIRMRGMGPQNTRIQIDGVAVSSSNRSAQLPLDELPADMIERIEVLRAPTAETQGAAGGTVNIVLRAASVRRETFVWLTDQTVWGLHAPSVYASQTGPIGAPANSQDAEALARAMRWSYFVSLAAGRQNWGSDTQRSSTSDPMTAAHYDGNDRSRLQNRSWTLTPRFTGRLGSGDRLIVRGLFSGFDQTGAVESQGVGASAGNAYSSNASSPWTVDRSFAQLGADWSHSFKSAKWDTTLQLERARNHYDTSRHVELDRLGVVTATDTSFVDHRLEHARYLSSKLTAAQGENLWTFGGEFDERKLAIVSSSTSSAGVQPLDQHSKIRRAALWGQVDIPLDSIKASSTWGLRAQDFHLEALHNGASSQFDKLFLQPSVNVRKSLSDTTQLRWNLARISRNPRLYELVNAVSPNLSTNSPNNPDFQGNPALKPQTTVTMDAGVERKLASSGQMGVNVFSRFQRDVIGRRVYLSGARWQEQPDNIGAATVWGIEADVKTGLTTLGLGADWTLSANASLLQSRMHDGAAAGERIPGQARYLANLNVTKPLKVSGGWYGGSSLSLVGRSEMGGSSNAVSQVNGHQRSHVQWDLFFGSVLQNVGFWRINIYNITDFKQDRTRTVATGGANYTEATVRRTTPRVFLTIGTRF
jgi:outer membrane receptor for ferrienterochelin and colicins